MNFKQVSSICLLYLFVMYTPHNTQSNAIRKLKAKTDIQIIYSSEEMKYLQARTSRII